MDAWPVHDGGSRPHTYLTAIMVSMVSSGVIMLVNAYKLSGTGCSPRKSKEVKTFSVKAFGELVEVDLEDQQEQEEKSKVAQSAYARYHEHKQQKIRLLQQN
eukprot:TRINITY_DN18640_c0_g1_i2.p3 TRINITY_DN18640_c0_g1~~TRINITY_DN18640_c0_g1_i2.p3  ORF type:complete len:102 (-),score=19.96 TRINITY_DN18640_c0_g1_i2:217-522(-)